MMKSHWDNWIKQPLPALGGIKPMDAVKTKDGREILDSLLTQFKRDATDQPQIGQTRETFVNLRARLGL